MLTFCQGGARGRSLGHGLRQEQTHERRLERKEQMEEMRRDGRQEQEDELTLTPLELEVTPTSYLDLQPPLKEEFR